MHVGQYAGTIEYGGASTGLEGTDERMGDPRMPGHFIGQQTPSLRTPLYTNHMMTNPHEMPSMSAGGFAHFHLQSQGGPHGQTNASFAIEVDEFKFFKIIRSVLFRAQKRISVMQSQTDDLASLFDKMEDDDFPTAEYDTNECFVQEDREHKSSLNIGKKLSNLTISNTVSKPKKLISEPLDAFVEDRSPRFTSKKD